MTMYKIEKRPSGYILTFSGKIDSEEMQKWYDESKSILQKETSKSFGVIIDMRSLEPIVGKSSLIMKNGQAMYKEAGMNRSAVILASSHICTQFKFIAQQSGIYKTERYIDASSDPNALKTAVKWVKDGIDPDI